MEADINANKTRNIQFQEFCVWDNIYYNWDLNVLDTEA